MQYTQLNYGDFEDLYPESDLENMDENKEEMSYHTFMKYSIIYSFYFSNNIFEFKKE